jgi:hypothetical protein
VRIVDLPSGWTTKEHCGSKSPIGARSADKVDIKTPPLLRPARRGLVGAGGVPGASRLRNTSRARRPAIARAAPYPAQPLLPLSSAFCFLLICSASWTVCVRPSRACRTLFSVGPSARRRVQPTAVKIRVKNREPQPVAVYQTMDNPHPDSDMDRSPAVSTCACSFTMLRPLRTKLPSRVCFLFLECYYRNL